jgi:hypothetical protein
MVAQQRELDRKPKPIGLGAVTIDQIKIGGGNEWRARISSRSVGSASNSAR